MIFSFETGDLTDVFNPRSCVEIPEWMWERVKDETDPQQRMQRVGRMLRGPSGVNSIKWKPWRR